MTDEKRKRKQVTVQALAEIASGWIETVDRGVNVAERQARTLYRTYCGLVAVDVADPHHRRILENWDTELDEVERGLFRGAARDLFGPVEEQMVVRMTELEDDKEIDPTAYRCGMVDWLDGEQREGIIRPTELEEELAELEDELADGAPEWIEKLVHAVHDDCLIPPDNYRYEFIEDMLDTLAEANDEDHMEELRAELEADVYTSGLTAWLHSSEFRVYYLSEVLGEFGDDLDGFQALSLAQVQEKQEVFDKVREYLRGLVESVEAGEIGPGSLGLGNA